MGNPKRVIVTAMAFAAFAPLSSQAQTAAQDAVARAAFEAADRGQPVPANAAQDPLAGWIELASMRRGLDTLAAPQADAFLAKWKGQPVGETFREAWLPVAAKRQDWAAFRRAWSPSIKSTVLRCNELEARQRTGAADAKWTQDAQAVWRSSGKALPGACTAPMTALAANGGLTPVLRWERIELAAAAWEPAVMRDAARGLPADELALANGYAGLFGALDANAFSWPKTPRTRTLASHALAKLAKDAPDLIEGQLPVYAKSLEFGDAEKNRVLYQIALWTVASYLPDSARRLAAVPEAAYDERLHEWRVREAMARSDWKAAATAITKMPAAQRNDSRWTYFAARLAERNGDKAAAQPLFRDAARKPDFHGFLAADRLNQPYALCPWTPDDGGAKAKATVAADAGIARAMALYRLDRPGWAQREWDAALAGFDDRQRRLAVAVAQDNGWYDRAVFNLKGTDETRLYTLRFPLAYEDAIRREAAKQRIDPAWVAAEIRAESIYNPRARSGANAMGLMQVLPVTGAAVAKRQGIAWSGPNSLYDPATNIALGTAYLREMEDKYAKTYVAIAAYNAGPTPTARWQSQRPGMDADFWIETISYKETREYVARVLAFSVLYDWRLDGNAASVTDRMEGRVGGARKTFACPG